MNLPNQKTLRIVLYEGEGAHLLETDQRTALMSILLQRGFAVTRSTVRGTVAPADRSSLLVLGKFDGPPPQPELNAAEPEIRFKDVTGLDAAAVADTVESVRGELSAARHGEWKPWFPVIDYDRCTNCMQCLSFCLFGVYGIDTDGKIQAQNHDNCKTNCPACSRVCPEAAIMFPKYKAGPINGDIVTAADLGQEKMKVDISALLGGDVYSALRNRSEQAKVRFSKERDERQALSERQKCLTILAQAGDIPAEVLMSLPSPDEIMRRAGEAKAKAQAALQRAAGNGAAKSS